LFRQLAEFLERRRQWNVHRSGRLARDRRLSLLDLLRRAVPPELAEEATLIARVHAPPICSTSKSNVSASQSTAQRTTRCVWPLVSPLSQYFCRERLQ
jgi:hypothetical protein